MSRVAIALLLLLAVVIVPAVANAADVVEASGIGELQLAPDQAILSLGVTTEAPAAKDALDANTRRMTAVLAALAGAGFRGTDVVTRAVSVTPVMEHRPQGEPRITGYRASNTVQVTSRDPATIGRALDAGVQAGANVAGGVAFGLTDPRAAETLALRLAVQDAQRRATAMVEALGRKLGRVIEVRAAESDRPTPRFEATALRAASMPTPIEPGLITVRAHATVKAEIR